MIVFFTALYFIDFWWNFDVFHYFSLSLEISFLPEEILIGQSNRVVKFAVGMLTYIPYL